MGDVNDALTKRVSGIGITKYESPLAYNLNDIVLQLKLHEANPGKTEPWKKAYLDEMKTTLQEMIKSNYKASSKTRLAFNSMEPDIVWEDGDVKKCMMKLTQRNVATVDPAGQDELQAYCLSFVKTKLDVIKDQGRAILKACYASDEEAKEVEEVFGDDTDEEYTLPHLGACLDLQEKLVAEFKLKFPVIESLRKREQWIQRLVKWEAEHGKDAATNKDKKNLLTEHAKFRASAASIYEKYLKVASDVIAKYEAASESKFMVAGEEYRSYLEIQQAQVARVKTNFAKLTNDHNLYFDHAGGRDEGSPIVGKICDPILEPLLEGLAMEPDVPFPDASDTCEFAFDYY